MLKSIRRAHASLGARLFLITCIISLLGCVSEEEKQERRENAFDVSGKYSASAGSEIPFEFEIKNEAGRHDIIVNLTRSADLSDKEKAALKESNIPAEWVKTQFFASTLVLDGDDPIVNAIVGGESISSDFGKTTHFSVCNSKSYSAEFTVSYCLSGTMSKGSTALDGHLSLYIAKTEKVKDQDGKESIKYSSAGNASLHYMTADTGTFAKQYLGVWTGEVFIEAAAFSSLAPFFKQIHLIENKGSVMLEVPSTFGTMSGLTLNYSSEEFRYDAAGSKDPMQELSAGEYPGVQLRFTSTKSPHRRIVLTAVLWSLGDLKGQILLIDENSETVLASIRHKKK